MGYEKELVKKWELEISKEDEWGERYLWDVKWSEIGRLYEKVWGREVGFVKRERELR